MAFFFSCDFGGWSHIATLHRLASQRKRFATFVVFFWEKVRLWCNIIFEMQNYTPVVMSYFSQQQCLFCCGLVSNVLMEADPRWCFWCGWWLQLLSLVPWHWCCGTCTAFRWLAQEGLCGENSTRCFFFTPFCLHLHGTGKFGFGAVQRALARNEIRASPLTEEVERLLGDRCARFQQGLHYCNRVCGLRWMEHHRWISHTATHPVPSQSAL